jgi:hypothetical protein
LWNINIWVWIYSVHPSPTILWCIMKYKVVDMRRPNQELTFCYSFNWISTYRFELMKSSVLLCVILMMTSSSIYSVINVDPHPYKGKSIKVLFVWWNKDVKKRKCIVCNIVERQLRVYSCQKENRKQQWRKFKIIY